MFCLKLVILNKESKKIQKKCMENDTLQKENAVVIF